MIGVSGNRLRYFRIQVCVSVLVSSIVYWAVEMGLFPAPLHTEALETFSIGLFTWGALCAAAVIVYFVYGQVLLVRAAFLGVGIGAGLFFAFPFLSLFSLNGDAGTDVYGYLFWAINIVGFIIVGGVSAWLGKLIGLLVLASLGLSLFTSDFALIGFTPVLGVLNITNVYAQWCVAIAISVSSFLADR